MICIKHDVTNPAEAPILMAAGFHANGDGSTALQMPDGTAGLTPCFAYQEPFQPGVFGFTPEPVGPYQACKADGQLVTFHTTYVRPSDGKADPPYTYTWATVPNA